MLQTAMLPIARSTMHLPYRLPSRSATKNCATLRVIAYVPTCSKILFFDVNGPNSCTHVRAVQISLGLLTLTRCAERMHTGWGRGCKAYLKNIFCSLQRIAVLSTDASDFSFVETLSNTSGSHSARYAAWRPSRILPSRSK